MPVIIEVVGSHLDNQPGEWGPPTATMNWCEEDYVVTPWIAEFWNTLSNFAFLFLVTLGAGVMNAGYAGHSLRYEALASLGGLLLIGLGSAAFHGTLLWHYQLLDELPMLYASCIFIRSLVHSPAKKHHGMLLTAVLVVYAVVVTVIYVRSRDFAFFVTAYGVQVAVIASGSFYHCIRAPTAEQRTQLFRLMLISLGFYFNGLVLWNVDNAYCPKIRSLRASLPVALQPLLQFHAAWHVFSAYGTYVSVVLMAYARGAADGLEPVLVAHTPLLYCKATRNPKD